MSKYTLFQDNELEVLILEDRDMEVELIQEHLEKVFQCSFRLRHFIRPEGAHKTLDHQNIDILLIDYRLIDGKTGLQFLQRIRAEGNRTPSLLITGYGDPEIEEQIEGIKRARYLDKNQLDPSLLNDQISEICQDRGILQ